MTRSRTLFTLCLTLVAASSLSAQEATPSQREVILATVDSFFAAMTRHDTVASRAVLFPGAMFYHLVPGRQVGATSDTAYYRSIASQRLGLQERIWNPTIWVHGPMAQVWTRYDFHVDGKFSHCGVDSFSLLQSGTSWKIVSITYTIEPTGCPESPLGPLP